MSRLKEIYKQESRPALQKQFGFKNIMLVPKLDKIVINMGVAAVTKEKNAIQDHVEEMAALAGQKPVVTKARQAIAGFKLREDMPLGIKVTLRGKRMYDFMYRFCNLACPRIRDFRGFNTKADGQGNYTLGLEDQQCFPEVNLDKVKRSQGMHITFVTTAQNDEECLELLRALGLPFKKAAKAA